MRSPYETKIILLLKATALAGALAARHEVPWCAAVSQCTDTTPIPQPRNSRGADWRLVGGQARSHRCGDPAPTGTPPRRKRAPGPCTTKRRCDAPDLTVN